MRTRRAWCNLTGSALIVNKSETIMDGLSATQEQRVNAAAAGPPADARADEGAMIKIGELLARDFSSAPDETVSLGNGDPETVQRELTDYIVTGEIRAAYERIFSAMVAALKSPDERVGIWISGFFGAGKSSFGKNLGYVLANREINGVSAKSLFLDRVRSPQVAECVELLNRTAPYEVVMFGVDPEPVLQDDEETEPFGEVMYREVRRQMDYAEDRDIAVLELELEKSGELAAFADLCLAEYAEEWRKIRADARKLARTSALLHRFDSQTYPSRGAWIKTVRARRAAKPTMADAVEKSFAMCETRRPGKALAFVADEAGQLAGAQGDRLEDLRATAAQFAKESVKRMRAGSIPGPAWVAVTAQKSLPDALAFLVGTPIDPAQVRDCFAHQVDLSRESIREVAAQRVLAKTPHGESVLKGLFREHGQRLIANLRLAGSTRRMEFDEDEFVRHYPCLPFFVDLFIDIVEGIRVHPEYPKHAGSGNLTLVKLLFEILASVETRFLNRPAGALLSLDKVYDLVEAALPMEKRKEIQTIRERFDSDEDYPKMTSRVAKTICLLEFARKNLPCTTRNLAAVLIQRVDQAPPVLPVASSVYHMWEAAFVKETEYGWLLIDLDKPRRAANDLHWQRHRIGLVNPRPPGWRSDLIQYFKKWFARSLTWYTRPLHEFHFSVTRSLQGVMWALERLSKNQVTPSKDVVLEQLSMDVIALERRLALSEQRHAALAGSSPVVVQPTVYILGLFGSGRRYINQLVLDNLGERKRYFRDTIRVHPGPTPMIYSGHATIAHISRDQEPPEVTSRILEAAALGYAKLIFIYRHPLDSLLTNWVWWRTYIRDNRWVEGISQIYKNTDELCADLERNFPEFKTFADGDPAFFAASPGVPFLSFTEFVEETELHLQHATVAVRLEDFKIDPRKEFSKIAGILGIDPDASGLRISAPKSKPYGYLTVQQKAPRFGNYIANLDTVTKRRIEKLGYRVES